MKKGTKENSKKFKIEQLFLEDMLEFSRDSMIPYESRRIANFYSDTVNHILGVGVIKENKTIDEMNSFSDSFHLFAPFEVLYKEIFRSNEFTTRPSYETLTGDETKLNVVTPELLIPNLWIQGAHNNQPEAFCQWAAPVFFHSIKTKTGSYNPSLYYAKPDDESSIFYGYGGFNLHHANNSPQVKNWSRGCQVFKKPSDLQQVYNLYNIMVSFYSQITFRYIILTQSSYERLKINVS